MADLSGLTFLLPRDVDPAAPVEMFLSRMEQLSSGRGGDTNTGSQGTEVPGSGVTGEVFGVFMTCLIFYFACTTIEYIAQGQQKKLDEKVKEETVLLLKENDSTPPPF